MLGDVYGKITLPEKYCYDALIVQKKKCSDIFVEVSGEIWSILLEPFFATMKKSEVFFASRKQY
jgi:hypothetical protein